MGFWKNDSDEQASSKRKTTDTTSHSRVAKPTLIQGSKVQMESAAGTAEVAFERLNNVRCAITSGTIIEGKLSFDTPVRIDGQLAGEVVSTEALIVGPSGIINARVDVKSLIVLGTVRGEVKAREKIEVLSKGRLEGKITTPVLSVAEGSTLNGECHMPEKDQARIVPMSYDGNDIQEAVGM